MYLVIISVLLILYTTILWRNFRLGTFLFLASLPAYLLRLDIFHFPTTVLELMFGLLAIFWFRHLFRQQTDWSFVKKWRLPFTLLLLAGIVSTLIAPDKFSALGILKSYIVEPMIFFLIIKTSIKQRTDVETALMFLGLGSLVISGFGIFQHLTGLTIPPPWDVEGRITSLFPYPNAVGLYLGPIIILGLGALSHSFNTKKLFQIWFWLLVTGSAVATIIFSQTEAAWVAIPTALLLTGLLIKKKRILCGSVIVVIALFIVLVPSVREKILLQDYSGQVRLKQWEESINMLQDRWLLGAGLNSYPTALIPYHTYKELEIFQYPHNIILNIWSELGLLGILAFLAFLWQTIWLIKNARQHQTPFFWPTLVLTATLIEMLIHGLVDVPFFKNDLAMLTAGLLALLTWSATKSYDS